MGGMTSEALVAWVKPPEPIRGMDHLGVQAPCVSIYTYLLPGITNVTDRARYYSFHPWVLWSFERRYTDHSLDSFRRVLRRAECLFALAAIRHSRVIGDGNERRHGARMVGRQELERIPEDATEIVLEDYAGLDGSRRYFKNTLGGLRQYYFGSLRDMQILDHSPHGATHPPGYDRGRGRMLAEAFARGVPEDTFFRLLEASAITWADLDGLAAFCPCAMQQSKAEYELLVQLFFARISEFQVGGGDVRRASLGLLLDLAGRNAQLDGYTFDGLLRGAAYTGSLQDGSSWEVHDAFKRAQRGWGVYQRNELLSLAAQGVFAAVLQAIVHDQRGVIRNSAEGGAIGARLAGTSFDLTRPLVDVVKQAQTELPELRQWLDERHELQRAWSLQELGRELADGTLQTAMTTSLEILIALLARGVDEDPYADIERDPESFDARGIHLSSLREGWRTHWSRMTIGDWVQWLSVEWGINRHLRVALRKLRGDKSDTFRIRPLEGELRVVEAPPPIFTAPRLRNCEQILLDLGLVDVVAEGALRLTQRGRLELEACHGR